MVGTAAPSNLTTKVGRNDPCPCGSGRKYKQCCQRKDSGAWTAADAAAQPSAADRRALGALLSDASRHAKAGRWREAVAAFAELARRVPNRAEAHANLGVAYLRLGRHAEAAASLERAVELRPGDERALEGLAAALWQCGRRAEAAGVYRKLGRIHSDLLERRHFAANALEIEGRFAEAEQELRRVLAAAPARQASRVLLGQLLLRRGAFDEAERCLAGALDAAPNAFRLLAKARRMTEADRPMIERMRALAEGPGLDPETLASVHFGLGKAFDDLAEYAQAMRHYDVANALKGGCGAWTGRGWRRITTQSSRAFGPRRSRPRKERRQILTTTCPCSSSACRAPAPRWSSRSCRRIPRSRQATNCRSGTTKRAAIRRRGSTRSTPARWRKPRKPIAGCCGESGRGRCA
jgi:tetratricopeptide (TPR) repeat protein